MTNHQRRCWDCGNVATHSDNVVPEVLCKKCGSQDTRLLKSPSEPTPFPWEVNGNAVHKRISPHYAQCICVCDGENRHANAQLIGNLADKVSALESEVERLKLYEQAWQSLAAQIVCPKTTAEEMAKRQLGIK